MHHVSGSSIVTHDHVPSSEYSRHQDFMELQQPSAAALEADELTSGNLQARSQAESKQDSRTRRNRGENNDSMLDSGWEEAVDDDARPAGRGSASQSQSAVLEQTCDSGTQCAQVSHMSAGQAQSTGSKLDVYDTTTTAREPLLCTSQASLHLHNMRISQHLRVVSTTSESATTDEISRVNTGKRKGNSMTRTRSSSGFESDQVPIASTSPCGRRSSPSRSLGKRRDDLLKTRVLPYDVDISLLPRPIARSSRHSVGLGPYKTPGHQYVFEKDSSRRRPSCQRPDVSKAADTNRVQLRPGHAPGLYTPKINHLSNDILDGSSDRNLSVFGTPTSQHSQDSFKNNVEETGQMWEKAFLAHQDRRVDQLVADEKRRQSTLRRLSHVEPRLRDSLKPADTSSAHQSARSRASSFMLDLPNTEPTLNRLALHDTTSIPEIDSGDTINRRRSSAFGHARVRSYSHTGMPVIVTEDRAQETRMSMSGRPRAHSHSRVYDEPPSGQYDIVTIPNRHPMPATAEGGRRRLLSRSSFAAWGRFPSHNRHERVLSAGKDDNVIARDFADFSSADDRVQNAETEADGSRKKRRPRATLRTSLLRKIFLVDIPNVFKSRSTGFNKGERGHRSSITPGGLLEFPELELLPIGYPNRRMSMPERQESSREELLTDMNADTTQRSMTNGSSHYTSRVTSSEYAPVDDALFHARSSATPLFSVSRSRSVSRNRQLSSTAPCDGPSEDSQHGTYAKATGTSGSDRVGSEIRRHRNYTSSPGPRQSTRSPAGGLDLYMSRSRDMLRSSTRAFLARLHAQSSRERNAAVEAAKTAWL
ncbi:hypothetical protein MRB53_038622 [Persea americana]|nr:hypothetical protein MRB53_038622 [Persea americana]